MDEGAIIVEDAMRAIGVTSTNIQTYIDFGFDATECSVTSTDVEVAGYWWMVAYLFERYWALIDMSLVGLTKQRVEWLVTADTSSTDSYDKHHQPLYPL